MTLSDGGLVPNEVVLEFDGRRLSRVRDDQGQGSGNSLDFFQEHRNLLGRITHIRCIANQGWPDLIIVEGQDGHKMMLNGLSWGYYGAGSNDLLFVLEDLRVPNAQNGWREMIQNRNYVISVERGLWEELQ